MSRKLFRKPTVSISIRFTEHDMAALTDAVGVKNAVTPEGAKRSKTELIRLLTLNWITGVEDEVTCSLDADDPEPVRPFNGDQIRWTRL